MIIEQELYFKVEHNCRGNLFPFIIIKEVGKVSGYQANRLRNLFSRYVNSLRTWRCKYLENEDKITFNFISENKSTSIE